jgi:peptidoglycan/LPS O-acetylase OafA/YrhL
LAWSSALGFSGKIAWLRYDPLKKREIELDFVRGVAILLAVGWHFNYAHFGFFPLDWLLLPGRTLGWAGVDLFFVLSGFLIGGLLFGEYAKTGRFSARTFLIRRAFKIWPILYLFLGIQIALGTHPWPTFLVQNLLHVQNFWRSSFPHLWSLAVEEHFYLVFAFCYALILTKTRNVHQIPIVLGVLCVVVLTCRIIAVSQGAGGEPIQWQTQFRIDSLACGVVLAYLRVFDPVRFQKLISKKLLLLVVWLSIVVVLANVEAQGRIVSSIGYTLAYIAGAAFLLFCYRTPSIVAGNWLVRGVAGIGVYSYAMYVYQFASVRTVSGVAGRLHLSETSSELFILGGSYIGAFLAGLVITKLVERPLLALREWLFPTHRIASESNSLGSPIFSTQLPSCSIDYPNRPFPKAAIREGQS